MSDGSRIVTTLAGSGETALSDDGPATEAKLHHPSGVVLDDGNLYVAHRDNNRLRVNDNGNITTTAGNGEGGYSGDRGPGMGAKLHPLKVVVAAAGTYSSGRRSRVGASGR